MIIFKEWIDQKFLLLEKKGEKHSYSCVLALFGKKDAQHVLDWSKIHVKDSNLHIAQDGGMGREDEIHVTVLYGLHTNESLEVENLLKDIKGFSINLGKISKFTSEDYDVLKIEIDAPYLHELNKKLKNLDYTSKFKEYVPHCTIAYVKKGSCDHLLGSKHFFGRKVEINSLTFSPAKGKKSKIILK